MLNRRLTAFTISSYLFLYALIGLAVLAKPFNTGDYSVHLGVINALSEGRDLASLPFPGDVMRLRDPQHVFWAAMKNLTNLSGTDTMALAGLANLAIFFIGVAVLARSLGPRRMLPLMLLLTLLLAWGQGYRWSNEYSLSVLPIVAPFPATLAWGLSFMVLALCHNWSRHGGRWQLLTAIALMAFVAAQHALTAFMFTLWFPVMWVWLGRTTWRRRWIIACGPLAALALSLAWPYENFIGQLASVGSSGASMSLQPRALHFLRPSVALPALGPAWAGIFFLPLAPKSWRRRLIAASAIYFTAWIGLSLAGVRLSHRFVFFLGFALQLPIAGAAARVAGVFMRMGLRANLAAPWVALAALLLMPWTPLHLVEVTAPARARVDIGRRAITPSPYSAYEALASRLKDCVNRDTLILTDHSTGKMLAAYGAPVVPDGGLDASNGGFTSLAPSALEFVRARRAITGATHLLFSPTQLLGRPNLTEQEFSALNSLGRASTPSAGFLLIEFKG